MMRSTRTLMASSSCLVAAFALPSLASMSEDNRDMGGAGRAAVAASATPSAARAASTAALERLALTSPRLRAVWRPDRVGPALVTGLAERTAVSAMDARARAFIQSHASVLGAENAELGDATVRAIAGRTVVSFPQRHNGVEVWLHSVSVTLDQEGTVRTLTNDLASIETVAPATLDLEAARRVAQQNVGAAYASEGRRVIVAGPGGAFEAALFFAAPEGTLAVREVVVNLHDGSVASVRAAVQH